MEEYYLGGCMIVQTLSTPLYAPPHIASEVEREVRLALAAVENPLGTGQFIPNNTECFKFTRHKPTRCVMNAADFISQTFERRLHNSYNWERQYKRLDQKTDAYKECEFSGSAYQINDSDFRRLVFDYWDKPDIEYESILTFIQEIWGMYVQRAKCDVSGLPEQYHHYFTQVKEEDKKTVRVGLEFETGNISSSFRSFMKLNFLFVNNIIDFGVFVTTNKEAAHNIWPPSNRNTTFEELAKRKYKAIFRFPLWEFCYIPDDYSKQAKFLNRDGTVYELRDTGETRVYNRKNYKVYIRGTSEEILIPES
jgi:hypothetical protein